MVAPSAIAFMIYYINKKELAFNKKILILVFLIICYIKSSTTLFLGITLSLLILLAFNYKEFSKKIKSIFVLIILSSTSILIFSDECISRFITIDPTTHSEKNYVLTEDQSLKEYMIKKIFNSKTNLIKKEDISIFQKFINKVEDQFELSQSKYEKNLTKAVQFHALSIFKSSVFERPFGWGINRYNKAYEYFDNKQRPSWKGKKLNKMDGTNNFVKIFVEFGIFGLFFYILIFLFIIEKKVPIELKLFYFPILITQSIRGAGYFNGGFILIAFLMLFTYIKLKKKI